MPTPTHVYKFNGNLRDHFGGPALEGHGGTIGGAKAYTFGANHGLSLALPIGRSYSIIMRHKVPTWNSDDIYAKLIDFKNRSSEFGLYAWGVGAAASVRFVTSLGETTSPGNVYTSGTQHTTAITRDNATGAVRVYVDGVQALTFTDTTDAAIFRDAIAHFFLDDAISAGSQAVAGSVNYLALFDVALSGAEVAAWNPAASIGPEIATPPTDFVERIKIAIVATLSARADIQGITGRATENVTAWNADMASTLPIIAYRVTVVTPGGGAIGDTREALITFSAIAANESDANALLDAVESIRWAPTLAALAQPLNGYMRNPVRREIPWDESEDTYRADLEMTLTATK